MMSISIPRNFDGQLFSEKFNIHFPYFYTQEGVLYYDPNIIGKIITENDISDCVIDTVKVQRIIDRENASKIDAKNIPDWATWSEQDAMVWINAHISDMKIDAITNLEDAKILLKYISRALLGIARMEIAIRNKLWPDLPED